MDIRLLAPTATCIGICISIILWILNQRKKELSYHVLWKQPLVNLRGAAKRQLDIRFKGERVNDAYLVILKIWNSGHLPITASEYQSQLKIHFNPGASIVSASVIETYPADLDERSKKNETGKAFIEKIQNEKIFLNAILLNPGDLMTLQVVARNLSGFPLIEGHIQGISKVHNWKRPTLIPRLFVATGCATMIFSMLAVDPSDIVSLGWDHILPFSLIWGCGFIVFYAGWRWLKAGSREYAPAISFE